MEPDVKSDSLGVGGKGRGGGRGRGSRDRNRKGQPQGVPEALLSPRVAALLARYDHACHVASL